MVLANAFLLATLAAGAAPGTPSVGPARVLELDPSTGRASLLLEQHDNGGQRTERVVLVFERGVVREPRVVCSFADDAPAADAAACRAKNPGGTASSQSATAPATSPAAFDLAVAGSRGKPPPEARARIDGVDVTARTTWALGDSGWPEGDGPAPAAAMSGYAVTVEVRAGAAPGVLHARVIVPFRDSEGMSWDDASAALLCRASAPRSGACMLVVIAVGKNDSVDADDVRAIVSAPFELGARPLDVQGACTGKLAVSVVADAGLVVTSGERIADSLTAAGCSVRAVEASKATRGKNVVYTAPKRDAAAKKIAAALGATVEPLTWKSSADVVVAVGR